MTIPRKDSEGICRAPSSPRDGEILESASDSNLLVARLSEALGSDSVRADEETRHAYAMDASPCYVPPKAVVFPRSEADTVRVVEICRELGVPMTPRAAGTSLSGAAVGPGVVLDTSRMAAIMEFNATEGWVRVGPGVTLLELNAWLRERGFHFPPDPGSLEWCRIGGMIGHNASGYRSVKYGQTRDHVMRCRVVLADGVAVDAHDVAVDGPEWRELTARIPAFETIRNTIASRRSAIRAARRPIRKHACGYDVFAIAEGLDRGVFPLVSLFVGSEGTLGIVTEATLRVLPLPERRVTILVYLDRLEDLGPLVADLLPLRPSALEAIDGDSLDLVGRASLEVPPAARAMLLAEFDDRDANAVAEQVVREIGPKYPLSGPVEVAREPSRQDTLWKARRALFPSLLKIPGNRKPWGFVEDPIVPADRVAEFIDYLVRLTQKYGTVAGVYGHIGDGNTHYRPLFNPLEPEDFERMCALREEFDEAVLGRFHGAPSAEHGIGRIRAETLPRIWGAEVYGVLRTIKAALDPEGLLNPGVLFGSGAWWESWGGLEARTPQ